MSGGTTYAAQDKVASAAGLDARPVAGSLSRASLLRSLPGGLLLLIRP